MGDYKPNDFYTDGYLRNALDDIKKHVKDDWDFIFTVDGVEGGGKSILAMQIMKYIDKSFSLDDIAFDPESFINKVITSKRNSVVLFDEAMSGLLSREFASRTNKTIVKVLGEIRQKNLIIGIVLPTFFDLDRNIALWRSRTLFHVYTNKKLERGWFSMYAPEGKRLLYMLGKKTYSYSKGIANPTFYGRFKNHYVVDEKKYRKLKFEALEKFQKSLEPTTILNKTQTKITKQRTGLITYIIDYLKIDKRKLLLDLDKLFSLDHLQMEEGIILKYSNEEYQKYLKNTKGEFVKGARWKESNTLKKGDDQPKKRRKSVKFKGL